ncbi:MAG: hypothetical protein E7181_04260 [Erysipelotrichaceae bacterium]|jgi:hypothetical protein|nr:hypothetical protein [Erysipelotrichaceae bacterium]
MKTNNSKKIVVSVLALAMGAGVAGSISGSMAWYQYSTRAYAAIKGTTVGTLGRLQLKADNDAEFVEYKAINGDEFRPTTILRDNGSLTFLDHPVYQVPTLPAIANNNLPYVDYVFNFRFQESTNGEDWADKTARNIYLSHFGVINAGGDGSKDVSEAVRAAFYVGDSTTAKAVLSNTSAKVTTTHGNLNLNNNNKVDTDAFDLKDETGTAIDYTNGATSYTTDAHGSWVLTDAELANIYTLDTTPAIAAKALCTTAQTLTVRIWLEGWELLNSKATWTKEYLAQNFELQMQFVCQADR